MKTVKQILEQNSYSNDTNSIVSGLSHLAECGLFDESKLPLIKRGLTKTNVNEMTEAEKKSLQYFVENLMTHVLTEQQDYLSKLDPKSKMAYPTEKDMPSVIVLKRKAIRVYPDNQKVALYYSQALDKYVSIPFGSGTKNLGNSLSMNEEEQRISIADLTTKKLKKISKQDPGKLTRIWHSTSEDPEQRQNLAGKLGAKQRSMVQGGNVEAIKYAAKHSNLPTAAGVAVGVGLRKAFETIRGTKPVAPTELKGSVPTISAKQGLQSDKVGSETPWGPRPEAKMSKPIKESFRQKLNEKRQEQLNELSWEDVKSGVKTAANVVGDVTGANDLISAGKKALSGDYAGAAGDAAWGGLKAATTVLPVGLAAKGAIAGGKLAAAGAQAAGKTGLKKAAATAGGAAKGALKGALKVPKAIAKGALALGGLAGGGGGSSDDGSASSPGSSFRSTGGKYDFGQFKNITIGGSGERTTVDRSKAKEQMAAWGGQPGYYSEQTNFNKIRILSENKDMEAELIFEDKSLTVNGRIAKKIMNIHESLNKRNKRKVEKMVNEDITSLRKIINFAVRQ